MVRLSFPSGKTLYPSCVFLAAVVLLLALAVYGQTPFFPFVHDDIVFIVNNPSVRSIQPVAEVFLRLTYPVSQVIQTNPYYRPLCELFHRIQFALFGLNAAWYHASNVLLHACNALLLYGILVKIIGVIQRQGVSRSKRQWTAFYTAVLFFIHPVQTEAVACVSGISNLLVTVFILSSFFLYLQVCPGGRLKAVVRLFVMGSALALYGLALMSKEQAVVFPVFLLAFEVWRAKTAARTASDRPSSSLLGPGVFALLTLMYFGWRRLFLGTGLPPFWAYPGELLLRLAAIPKTLAGDILLVLCPVNLHYYRSVDILGPQEWGVVALLALFFSGRILFLRLPRESRALPLLGLWWFLIFLLPMLNIFPLIHEYSLIAAFEHFLYLPSAGLLLFLVSLFTLREENRPASRRFHWTMIAAISLLALTAARQAGFWRGEIPLFQRVTRLEPGLARGHILMARAYFQKGRLAQARAHEEKALNRMMFYEQQAGNEEARRFYRNTLKEIHRDLAMIATAGGDEEQAGFHLEKALTLAPDDAQLRMLVGLYLVRQNICVRAIPHFEAVLRLFPGDPSAMNNLAFCYIRTGRCAEAVSILKRILKRHPGDPVAARNLTRLIPPGHSQPVGKCPDLL